MRAIIRTAYSGRSARDDDDGIYLAPGARYSRVRLTCRRRRRRRAAYARRAEHTATVRMRFERSERILARRKRDTVAVEKDVGGGRHAEEAKMCKNDARQLCATRP